VLQGSTQRDRIRIPRPAFLSPVGVVSLLSVYITNRHTHKTTIQHHQHNRNNQRNRKSSTTQVNHTSSTKTTLANMKITALSTFVMLIAAVLAAPLVRRFFRAFLLTVPNVFVGACS
jgi:exosortase/archaeosortase